MATTTNLSSLKINYLTQEQYDAALANSQINENELYLTPGGGAGDIDVTDMTEQEVEEFVEALEVESTGPMKGVILYSGTANTGSFTLTDNIANYERVSIIAIDNDNVRKTFDIYPMGSSSFQTYLDFTRIVSGWYTKSATLQFDNSTVTFMGNAQAYFSSQTADTFVTVLQVIGFKTGTMPIIGTEHVVTDYIIDQGTSGIWTYRKWNSGIAECWGISAQRTVTSWPTWGYINYGDPYTTYDTYPTGLFISTPVCEAQLCGASADCWLVKGVVSNTATAANTPCFYLARGTAATGTVTYTIAYHAIGRWK